MAANIAQTRGRKALASIARKQITRAFSTALDIQQPYVFAGAVAAYSFTPPAGFAGRWKFVGWGPGGGGANGANAGGAGGYFEITSALTMGQTVTITAGRPTFSDTSVVLPNGRTATATRGNTNSGAAGAGSGGDVNLAGTAGPASTGIAGASGLGTGGGAGGAAGGGGDGGAGAPANLPFRGGQGAAGATPGGAGHGAGGGDSATLVNSIGGSGLVIAVFLGD